MIHSPEHLRDFPKHTMLKEFFMEIPKETHQSIDMWIRAAGSANTFDKPGKPKMTRIWFKLDPYFVWYRLPGDSEDKNRHMLAEHMLLKLLLRHGFQAQAGSAPTGAIAFKLKKKHEAR